MSDFTKKEKKLFKKLNSPAKVQDFLNKIPFNFEMQGRKKIEMLKSPILTLRARRAHCFEGALLGAYILSLHNFPPLILHLQTTSDDYDHVIAPFKIRGYWGALSKTNHAVLRYREPVYKNIRELVMSYFHEYFLKNGKKTLRKYSSPLNLNIFGKKWVTHRSDLWEIDKALDKVKHHNILPKSDLGKQLRKAEKIEIRAGEITEWRK